MFIALPLPETIRSDLDRFCEPRRQADDEWSWTRPAGWHLTLAFMADVPSVLADDLEQALSVVAERRAPLTLSLAGGGVFGHPDRAHVLYVRPQGEVGGHAGLDGLAATVRTAVRRTGIELDERRFTAHLTLGRSRAGVSAVRWLRVVDTYVSPTWTADRITLFSSTRRGSGGFDHRIEAEWRLGADRSDR